jgi:Zn-finger nucleic acid-binding protein
MRGPFSNHEASSDHGRVHSDLEATLLQKRYRIEVMAQIEIECPGCGGRGRVPEAQAGKNATCPRCRTEFKIEAKSEQIPTLAKPAERSFDCPICLGAILEESATGWLCSRCQGSYLENTQTSTLLRSLGIDPALLGEMQVFSRAEAVPCAGCAEAMTALSLKGATVDHCRSCGGLWLDGGELHKISAGRLGEPFDPSLTSTFDEHGGHDRDHLESILTDHQVLRICQDKEWTEIIVGWETSNRYGVLAGDREVAYVFERGSGVATALGRQFMGSHRPLDVQVTAGRGGRGLLFFERPFYWFFSSMKVYSEATQKAVGRIERKFAILHRVYELHDETGRLFARIRSPWWRFWTFPVVDLEGQRRAVIAKKWSGLFREGFTDADSFAIDFGDYAWTLSQRAVLFAAAISIDFDFFENNQR